MAVVPDEDELAADAHVEAGDDHDGPRDHAPQQQKEQSPTTMFKTSQVYAFTKAS